MTSKMRKSVYRETQRAGGLLCGGVLQHIFKIIKDLEGTEITNQIYVCTFNPRDSDKYEPSHS